MTPQAVPLGSIRSIASTSAGDELRARRKGRWRLLAMAGELLPGESVARCCKHMIPEKPGVPVVYTDKNKSAHFRNLIVCGSVWMCPICAARISEKRRIELTEAVKRSGHAKILVTLTLQHSRGDRLADLRSGLNSAFRRLKSGRWYKDLQRDYGLAASVTASEITWGNENGWHYHKHVLFFSSIPMESFNQAAFRKELVKQYTDILKNSGLYASNLYGVDVRFGDDKAVEYASKWGLEAEVTKANIKQARSGYSPFQLLELYEGGKSWAGALFVEYASTMKGHNQLVWSRGGRAALGLGVEQSDEELAADQEEEGDPGVVLTVLNFEQFQKITRLGLRGDVLESASYGDRVRLWEYLKAHGINPTRDQIEGVVFHGP